MELRITCSPPYLHAATAPCHGWAGTFDAALYLRDRPGLWLVDWKTSATRRGAELLEDYFDQLGAYHAGTIQHNPSQEFAGGAVVIARRAGPPDVHWLSKDELLERSHNFHGRFVTYLEKLRTPAPPPPPKPWADLDDI